MRLGITLQETYTLVLVVLVLLAAFGTSYCQWAIRKATEPEQIERIRVVNSRVKMGLVAHYHLYVGFFGPVKTSS